MFPKISSPPKHFTGGLIAMTAKTGAKFAVGVVSLIAVGMIGFQIANHSHAPLSPDSSMVQSTTQPTNQMSRTASTQPASGQAGHQKVNVARGDSINAVLVPKAPVKENPTEDAFPPMEAHKESATITEESHNQSTRLQTGRSETVFEKYLRIKNSPEFQRDWTAEVDGIFEKYVSSIHEREALEQEQQRLQETLVEASEENRAEIDAKIETLQADLKAAKARENELAERFGDAGEKVYLQYGLMSKEVAEGVGEMIRKGMLPRIRIPEKYRKNN